MPEISIKVSEYTYWKLLGAGESASTVIQKALQDYWEGDKNKLRPQKTTLLVTSE